MTSRRLMSVFLALMLALPAIAQNASTAPAAKELTALLEEFLDGASRNDVAVHERFWADDLIHTSSSGLRTMEPSSSSSMSPVRGRSNSTVSVFRPPSPSVVE